MLKHVVLFRLLPGTDDQALTVLLDELEALAHIPGVHRLSAGRDVSGRGDYHLALTCEFHTLEDLRRYLAHAAHVRVVTDVLPQVVHPGWQVVDYWTPRSGPPDEGRGRPEARP